MKELLFIPGMALSMSLRYRFIKKLDSIVFPDKPISIKIVWKGRGAAAYCNSTKKRGDKIIQEWYQVYIVANGGNDFNRAVHEVRHRIQWHNPQMPLFTKNKLLILCEEKGEIKEQIQQIIRYMEKVEKMVLINERRILSEKEQDAIIVERAIAMKCEDVRNQIEEASRWIKETSSQIFLPFFSSP